MMYESVCWYGCNTLVPLITASQESAEWRWKSLVGVIFDPLIKTNRTCEKERWLLNGRDRAVRRVGKQICLPSRLVGFTADEGWLMAQFVPVALTLEGGLEGGSVETWDDVWNVQNRPSIRKFGTLLSRFNISFKNMERLGLFKFQRNSLILTLASRGRQPAACVCAHSSIPTLYQGEGIIAPDWLAGVHYICIVPFNHTALNHGTRPLHCR